MTRGTSLTFAASLVLASLIAAPAWAEKAGIAHIVLFDMKDDVAPETVERFIAAGKSLLSDIPGVAHVAIGHKAMEDRGVHIKDYDVGLYLRFRDQEAMDGYGPHPLHKVFVDMAKPLVANMKVIDFHADLGAPSHSTP